MHFMGTATRLLAPLALLVILQGCVITLGPQLETNADQLAARAKKLRTILILTPDITINELTAGDVKEERPAWSQTGRGHIVSALRSELSRYGWQVKVLETNTSYRQLVDEVMSLQPAVMKSIYDHAVRAPGNMEVFPERIAHFDYTLGPVDSLLHAYRADGMLVVRGQDNISTVGRKALGVVKALNPFDPGQRGGMTYLETVLTDQQGDILWWQLQWNEGGIDLRQKDDAQEMVRDTLGGIPGRKS